MKIVDKYILFADDDVDDQDLLKEAFDNIDSNLKIEIVSLGKEAISFLESKKDDDLPALILLDYNIPDMTGAKIINILSENKRFSKIPKVVWSTSNSPFYKKVSLEAGADFYFEKPVTYNAVLDLVMQLSKMVK